MTDLSLSRADKTVEISFEAPAHEVSVLDGYCQAHNLKRGTQLRQILREWSAMKHRESILICRVVGSNPTGSGVRPDSDGASLFASDQAGRA